MDVITLKEPVTPAEAIDAVATSGHSRYPVIGNNLDELRGMLYVKDLLRLGQGRQDIDTAGIGKHGVHLYGDPLQCPQHV